MSYMFSLSFIFQNNFDIFNFLLNWHPTALQMDWLKMNIWVHLLVLNSNWE